jgi:transposase
MPPHSLVHCYLPISLTLYQAGHLVSVVNPARIAAYANSQLARNKTDAVDAQLIARFCLKEEPRATTPPTPEVRDLRALVRTGSIAHR